MGKFCVGIDLGGTFVKSALLDREMNIVARAVLPTPADRGPGPVIEAMAQAARAAMTNGGARPGDVLGVGIGSPGPLDLERGIVIAMPNIPGFDNVPLAGRVGAALGLPATLENDATAAAYGEYLCGSGKGTRNMVLMTLGTGIGGGVVVEGRVMHGTHGNAAEIGHMIVVAEGELCGCGQHGCLERYASATYLAQRARRAIEGGRASSLADVLKATGDITSKDVNAAAKAGDALAAEFWDQACYYLAVACVSLTRVFDPDLIVFAGGMVKAGDDLLRPVLGHFERLNWKLMSPKVRIALAKLGNDAGVIGAAGVAWAQLGK